MSVVPRLRNADMRWQAHKSWDLTWQLRIQLSKDDWNHQFSRHQLSPASFQFYFHWKNVCVSRSGAMDLHIFFSFWKKNPKTIFFDSPELCYFSQEKYKPLHIYLSCINILIVNIVLWGSSYQYSCLAHANLQWAEHWYEAADQGIKGQGVWLNRDSI